MLRLGVEWDHQDSKDQRIVRAVVFVNLETFTATGVIGVIALEPVVVLPRVCELTYVPAPEGLQ